MIAQRGIGAVYGTSRDQPYDRWFRYPAGFSPDALGRAVNALGGATRIVDPFFGSAATATAVAGTSVTGIEAHPLIAHLASTKLAAPPRPVAKLRRLAETIAEDARGAKPTIDDEHELVRRCFDADVLGRLVALRDATARRADPPWERYLRWALLGTLRDVASVKVGWPYQRPGVERDAPYRDPVARMLTRVDMIAADLEVNGPRPTGRVLRGDSRAAGVWTRAAADGSFDGCVTSPPYLNNFDYADATRLELYFLGVVSTWQDMCRHVRAGMVVATTQQSARGHGQRALARLTRDRPDVAGELATLTERLRQERENRDRGKEYDQVVPAYFADIARVLDHLHRHTTPGAVCAWIVGDSAPYGIYVDTPALISRLAESSGFAALKDETIRSRGLRWRTNGSRHQVPLTERLITFKRV